MKTLSPCQKREAMEVKKFTESFNKGDEERAGGSCANYGLKLAL